MSSIVDECFNFEINIWLYVYIGAKQYDLAKCLNSLSIQDYNLLNILLIDDNANEKEKQIIEQHKLDFNKFKSVKIVTNEISIGYSKCKLDAFEIISKTAQPNDIFTELYTYSRYCSTMSLKYIIYENMLNKSWFLYGNYVGEKELRLEATINDDLIETAFYYSCSAFMLTKFEESDFQSTDGSYLSWGYNKMFAQKCIGLCGDSRTYASKMPVCELIGSPSFEESPSYISIVNASINNKRVDLLPDKLHIVIYVFYRHYNLASIVKSIDASEFNKTIVLHIVNCIPDKWEEVLALQHIAFDNLKIVLCNTNEEQPSYCRILYLRKLLKTEPSSYAILLDDEMVIPQNWIDGVYNSRKPLSYGASKGIVFDKHRVISEISFYDNSNSRTFGKNYYDYGSNDGSILDMNVVLHNTFQRLDKRFILCLDELWLSFVVNHILGSQIMNIGWDLYNRASDDIVEHRSNIQFVDDCKELMKALVDLGYIKSKHINVSGLSTLLAERSFFEDRSRSYEIVPFNTYTAKPFSGDNVVLYLYYDDDNNIINNFCNHTIKNYCLKINTNLITINMTSLGKDNVECKISQIKRVFTKFKRMLFIDGAYFINKRCPNLFDIVPNEELGCIYNNKNVSLDIMLLNNRHSEDILGNFKGDKAVFNIGDKCNYNPYAKSTVLSEEEVKELLNQNILNLNSLKNCDVELLRKYKTIEDEKITLMIMNCHRPSALINTILPYYDMNCSDLIDQIIIYHAKRETKFEYNYISKNIFTNNVFDEKEEERYVLFNRYIQPDKLAFNKCILIVDDDVIPNREVILTTLSSWKRNKMNTHGCRGRVCEDPPLFTYSFRDYILDRAPIILTSFLMTSLELIQQCITEEPHFYEIAKRYKPIWNGEDILLSILAMKITNQRNFIINTKNRVVIFRRDTFAISSGFSHVECRTELVNILCDHYNINKTNALL